MGEWLAGFLLPFLSGGALFALACWWFDRGA